MPMLQLRNEDRVAKAAKVSEEDMAKVQTEYICLVTKLLQRDAG